jgi:tRNA threonylcarbamoyladenosine biosynthesis protein TsaB
LRLLALDTALEGCSVGVFAAARLLAMRRRPGALGHAEQLPSMLADLLGEARLGSADLDGLAVTIGPGSFSGIRTGLAAARALALVYRLPVFGVRTFEALAAPLANEPGDERPIAAIIDARRGQVYLQLLSNKGLPLATPASLDPEAAAGGLVAPIRLVGNGVPLLRSFLPQGSGFEVAEACLDAAAVALAAEAAAERGVRPIDGMALKPFYLRDADARPDAGRALLPVGS